VLLKTGCQWRQLPREFPVWTAVYYYFRGWFYDGTWARLHHLLHARLRQKGGRNKPPTAGCLDSQSVKCTAVSGVRGFDAGKLINGRKRHLLVDTVGWLMAVVVTAANERADGDGARWLLSHLPGGCKKLRKMWVDGGYSGRLVEWVAKRFKFYLAGVWRSQQTKKLPLIKRRKVSLLIGWGFLHAVRAKTRVTYKRLLKSLLVLEFYYVTKHGFTSVFYTC
jgi:putative transposase